MLQEIESKYDPNSDTRPDGPPVTWAEYALYCNAIDLEKEIRYLKFENTNLKDKVSALETQLQRLDETVRDLYNAAF